jgi:sulfhydrogenase subunit alpha
MKNPMFNNLAQAIEIVWCLEQVPGIVDSLLKIKKDPDIVQPSQTEGEGIGAVEAPRGILYHAYKIKDGLVADANFIIPTGQNLADIERYMRLAVDYMTDQDADDSTIQQQVEMIVRAYDPCISCSTHLVRIQH